MELSAPNSRIRALREAAHDMDQEDLARLVDLSREQIAKIETGRRRVTAHEIRLFAEAFDVRVEDLLLETGVSRYRADGDEPTIRPATQWFDDYIHDSLRMRRMDSRGL